MTWRRAVRFFAIVALALAAAWFAPPAQAAIWPFDSSTGIAVGAQPTEEDQFRAICRADLSYTGTPADSCWGCAFIGYFMEITTKVSREIYHRVAAVAIQFVGYFFMIWLAVHAIKMMFIGGGMQSVMTVFWKCAILLCIYYFMSYGSDTLFEIVFMVGFGIPAEIAEKVLKSVAGVSGEMGGYIAGVVQAGSAAPMPNLGSPVLDKAGHVILSLVWTMQRVVSIALNILAMPLLRVRDDGGILAPFAGLATVFVGWYVFLLGGIPLIGSIVALTFYMLDLIFRVTLVLALAPLIIAGAFLRPFQSPLEKMARGVVGSGLNLINAAIIYTIMAGFIAYTPKITGVGSSLEDLCMLVSKDTLNALSVATGGFWWLFACGMIGGMALKRAKEMTDFLIGFRDGQGMAEKAAGAAAAVGKVALVASVAGTFAAGAAALRTAMQVTNDDGKA